MNEVMKRSARKAEDLQSALINVLAYTDGRAAKPITTEAEVANLIVRLSEKCMQDRRDAEGNWLLNVSYCLGEQYVKLEQARSMLTRLRAPDYRVRHMVNLVAPSVQRIIAKVTRHYPNVDVIPRGTDDASTRGALLCQNVIDAKFQQWKIKLLLQEIAFWALNCSRAYLRTTWDPDAGEEFTDPTPVLGADGQPVIGPDGQPATSSVVKLMGDVAIEVDTPFDISIEPGVKSIYDSRWALATRSKPLGWVLDRWPEVKDNLCSKQPRHGFFANIMRRITDAFGGASDDENHVPVYEFWLRPDKNPRNTDKWRKQGMYLVVVGDQVVEGPDRFPYKHGLLPWVEFTDGFCPGVGANGPTMVRQLRPTQNAYNQTWSMKIENARLMGRPKVLVPSSCNVPDNCFTSEPGEVVTFDQNVPGVRPEFMFARETDPRSFEEMLNRALKDCENITAQHEASRGLVPTGVESGVALQQLAEQDETMLAPLTERLEGGIEVVARMVLHLFKEFGANRERELTLSRGAEGYMQVSFKGIDLSYSSIRVEPGSLKPRSRAAEQAQILEWYKLGLFNPSKDEEEKAAKRRVIQMLQFGQAHGFFEEANLDRRAAQFENDQLEVGKADFNNITIQPQSYNDHREHIRVHRLRMKDPSFQELPEKIRMAFEQHVNLHKYHQVDDQNEMANIMADLVKYQLVQVPGMPQGGLPPGGPAPLALPGPPPAPMAGQGPGPAPGGLEG